MFINSTTQSTVALVQETGRPDLTAKLHLIELPFYLLVLWWLLGTFGIEGAAVACVVRVAVDALVLFVMAHLLLPTSMLVFRRTVPIAVVGLLTLVLAALPTSLVAKGLFLSLTLPAFVLAAWFLILAPTERALLQAEEDLADER